MNMNMKAEILRRLDDLDADAITTAKAAYAAVGDLYGDEDWPEVVSTLAWFPSNLAEYFDDVPGAVFLDAGGWGLIEANGGLALQRVNIGVH